MGRYSEGSLFRRFPNPNPNPTNPTNLAIANPSNPKDPTNPIIGYCPSNLQNNEPLEYQTLGISSSYELTIQYSVI